MPIRTTLILILLCATTAQSQYSRKDFEKADSLVRRLPPSAFHELPAGVRLTLERGGFTIPQTWEDSLPHNVIRGQFRAEGQTDWAVLASKKRVSCILIFWNGSATDTTHLEPIPDAQCLQTMGEHGIVFSHRILTTSLEELSDCGNEGGKPIPVDHEALEDLFLSKGSTRFYFHQGHWCRCPGED